MFAIKLLVLYNKQCAFANYVVMFIKYALKNAVFVFRRH